MLYCPFERCQPTFYSLQQVNKKMVNVSLKKKNQHSFLKKCVTVESDARSILAGALGRFALAFVLQDFLDLRMPRQRVAQCTTSLVCTKISMLSAHHIYPDLVASLSLVQTVEISIICLYFDCIRRQNCLIIVGQKQ